MNFTLFLFSRNQSFLSNSISFLNNLHYHKQCYCSLVSQRSFLGSYKLKLTCQPKKSWNYSTEPEKDQKPQKAKLPPLMNFPKLVWPSIGNSIKNFFLSTFIIKPYMDNEFSLQEFILGSKKAVDVVSNKLSTGEMKSLEGLVTDEIIPALQARLSIMSLSQREQLATSEDDIYFSFPYQVGIIFNDDENDQKRFVEITMVHHSLKGLAVMKSRGEDIPINIGLIPEYQDKICIANYRYIKEFTKGVQSDWTINLVNHFKPVDEVGE